MTPFNTALTRMSQSTPQAIFPRQKPLKKTPTVAPLQRPTVGANAQTDAYGKAMRSAIKNTKVFR